MSEAKVKKEEKALAEKQKKEEQDKLEKEKKEKLAIEKEEQNRIAKEKESFEEQAPITEETVDPRTTDPRSEYYQATPEEIEQGRLMEQQVQDDFWANQDSNN